MCFHVRISRYFMGNNCTKIFIIYLKFEFTFVWCILSGSTSELGFPTILMWLRIRGSKLLRDFIKFCKFSDYTVVIVVTANINVELFWRLELRGGRWRINIGKIKRSLTLEISAVWLSWKFQINLENRSNLDEINNEVIQFVIMHDCKNPSSGNGVTEY
jgi:hypothetical protein